MSYWLEWKGVTRITFVRSKKDRNSLSTRMKGGADGWERRNDSNGDYQKNSLRRQNRMWYISCLCEEHQDGQYWLKWKKGFHILETINSGRIDGHVDVGWFCHFCCLSLWDNCITREGLNENSSIIGRM